MFCIQEKLKNKKSMSKHLVDIGVDKIIVGINSLHMGSLFIKIETK